MTVVSSPNPDMVAAWDGPEGDHWTEFADRYDAATRAFDRALSDRARVTASDVVVDLGCGCGISSLDAAHHASRVVGIDLSRRMLEHARERARAAGLANVRFEHADAQTFVFEPATFTVGISRFGGMFFGDPVAAYRNVARALAPGGRLAMTSWRRLADNGWVLAIRDALAHGRALPEPPVGRPGPFGLADPDDVRTILGEAGFASIEIAAIDAPVRFGGTVDDAFAYVRGLGMARALLNGLAEADRPRALDALRARLEAAATADGVAFQGGALLITALRR